VSGLDELVARAVARVDRVGGGQQHLAEPQLGNVLRDRFGHGLDGRGGRFLHLLDDGDDLVGRLVHLLGQLSSHVLPPLED
jgi:hypothetical protein